MNVLDTPPMIALPEGKGFILLNSLSNINLNNIDKMDTTDLQEIAYEQGASEEEIGRLGSIKELEQSVRTIQTRVSTTLFNMTNLIESSLEKNVFNEVMGDLDRITKVMKKKMEEQ